MACAQVEDAALIVSDRKSYCSLVTVFYLLIGIQGGSIRGHSVISQAAGSGQPLTSSSLFTIVVAVPLLFFMLHTGY
jgi:hypothetical protein